MKSWSLARTSLAAAAVVIAVEAVLLANGNRAVLHGALFDPDCYMHLQRALRLMREGHWHETIDPRINAPFGFAIHWTGLFDILLAAGATPLTWFGLDARQALYIWGSAISPLLLTAALAAFAWGVRPRVSGALYLWLTILLFTQPQLSGAFLAGRPDHHSLVLGLMMAQLAWAYQLFDGRTDVRHAVLAGVLAGVQLVTSVEALLTILVITAGIAAAWLVFGRNVLKEVAVYLGACVATIVAWLSWESGGYLLAPAYDRLSVVHVLALACGTLVFVTLAAAERRDLLRSAGHKFGAMLGSGAVAVAITAYVFPDFFLGPWPHLDPVIVAWHKEINELMPLLPTSGERLAGFFAQMTAPILSLPLVVTRLRRGQDQPLMLLTLIGFAVFGALAMAQMRWSSEVQAMMLLPWTLSTVAIMQSTLALPLGRIRVPLRAFGLSGALLLQLMPGAMARPLLKGSPTQPEAGCNWSGAALALPHAAAADSIVMMPVWYGPEVLWRSDLRVVAGPYEILPALADTKAFFQGSEATAHAIVARRHIDYVLVCTHDRGHGFGKELAGGKKSTWLAPAPLTGALPEFRLYRVTR